MFCGANQVASTRQFVSQTWHLGWFRRKILVVKSNVKKFYPLCSDCIYSTIVLAQELTKELQKKTRAVTLLMEKVVFWRMHSRHLMVDSILMNLHWPLWTRNQFVVRCCSWDWTQSWSEAFQRARCGDVPGLSGIQAWFEASQWWYFWHSITLW